MQHFYAAIYASVLCNSTWNSSLCSIFMHFMSPLLTFLLALIYTAVFATTTATITTATDCRYPELLQSIIVCRPVGQLDFIFWPHFCTFPYYFLSDS